MYRIIQAGQVIKAYDLFVDAWLYVRLELSVYARIKGPDGTWSVNPRTAN